MDFGSSDDSGSDEPVNNPTTIDEQQNASGMSP